MALILAWEGWAHYWLMPRGTQDGKPLLPCGIYFRICTVTPPLPFGASAVAQTYHAHSCNAACKSNYLLYPAEDVTMAVDNAASFSGGLGVVCADVVESLNAIVKRAYNDHMARCGRRYRGQDH